MANISIRIPDAFHRRLAKKSKELGFHNLSDGTRFLLNSAMDAMEKNNPIINNPKVLNKQLQYIATTYYLLKDYIGHDEKISEKINNNAHEKAVKAIEDLLK